jgi:hypothetical protein
MGGARTAPHWPGKISLLGIPYKQPLFHLCLASIVHPGMQGNELSMETILAAALLKFYMLSMGQY